MYKAIVFVRTSTDRQEMESQRNETLAFAKHDGGFSDDEIKVIGTNGASAIKLSKTYLADIQEIYDTVNSHPIECVYAFDLDRLGRNEVILVTLKHFLIEKRVNLKLYVGYLSLLNPDKTVNDSTNILFALTMAQAESEMRNKKARFERARNRNYSIGKYMGGYVPYGYKVDDNGFFQVNEEESKIIKLIYSLFNNGEYSSDKLAKELNDRGYLNGVGNMFNAQYIRLILKSELYSGECTDVSGRIMKYPPIVSVEEQMKAKSILLRNNKTQNKAQTHFYFGNKLIVCQDCGHHYLRKSGVYTCAGRQLANREGQSHIANCNNALSIAVNCMDGILWDLTKRELIKDIESDNDVKEKEAIENIKIINQKIKTLSTKLQKYQDKIEEIILKGDRMLLSENLIEKRISIVQEQQREDEKVMVSLSEEKRRYEQVLTNREENLKELVSYNSITDIEIRGDEKVMSDIIHKYIQTVTIEKTPYKGIDKFILINVEMKNGVKFKVWFNGRQKKGARAYLWCSEDETEEEYTFANIERVDGKVTSTAIQNIKELQDYCTEFTRNHQQGELWKNLINSDNKINKLFLDCLNYNNQQVTQMVHRLMVKEWENK